IYASVIATILFALWANMPVAVAPGMGLNAFFTYTVVLGQGLAWQTALGAVFISGVVFLILTATGIRKKLVDGVPDVLRSAIGVGIGLFIAFIG
ncbi:NCS2 family permease, partial [Frankia sp. Cpl3]|nr:NCS2 family permease [Frankia sp. Cpl3]